MNAIGGYFGLDKTHGCFAIDGVAVNSARNALRYIIRAYSIKAMWVPYYTCPVVWDALRSENIDMHFYSINENLFPIIPSTSKNAFMLANNYFGIYGNNVQKLSHIYPNLIVDNAQAFYAPRVSFADFSSPRKFFGLPDGGIARCDAIVSENLQISVSWDRCLHLLKRADCGATAGYSDFVDNDEALIGRPVEYMSNLTKQMLGNIDYYGARKIRLQNFEYLHKHLGNINLLQIDMADTDVPMVYPFMTNDSGIRQRLIQNKIFVAKYWPGIEQECCQDSFELKLQNTLIPLPIDQRYDIHDMQRILEVIND